jgi:hypothetical protein
MMENIEMTSFVSPQHRQAWKALQVLANSPQPHLRELLKDPQRVDQFHASGAGITSITPANASTLRC